MNDCRLSITGCSGVDGRAVTKHRQQLGGWELIKLSRSGSASFDGVLHLTAAMARRLIEGGADITARRQDPVNRTIPIRQSGHTVALSRAGT